MDPSAQIVEARKAAGLTQAALARRSRTTQSAINRYERGQVRPRPATLERILRSSRKRRPSEVLAERRDEVLAFAREHGISSVRVFGSVARGDDDVESDIDLLMDIPSDYSWFGLVGLQLELSDLLGVSVDVGSESDLHPRIKERVLAEARPL